MKKTEIIKDLKDIKFILEANREQLQERFPRIKEHLEDNIYPIKVGIVSCLVDTLLEKMGG